MKHYVVTMSSNEYGSETFDYSTFAEAMEGLTRLKAKANQLNDDVDRSFDIEDVPEHRSTENGCEDGCEACAMENRHDA